MAAESKGYDYGGGMTNISPEGIRFGVMSQNMVDMDFAEKIWSNGRDVDWEAHVEKVKNDLHRALEDYYVGVSSSDAKRGLRCDLKDALAEYLSDFRLRAEEPSTLDAAADSIMDAIEDRLGTSDPKEIQELAFEAIKQDIGEQYEHDGDYDCMLWEDEDYKIKTSSGGDLWILKSPYYTFAQFCSPCAPGACHLEHPLEEKDPDNKCYCLHHEWFEKDKAPYPVYRIEDDSLVAFEEY